MNKNCPNCGAPRILGKSAQTKCPYCGTLFLDFTVLDMDNRSPCFITVKHHGRTLTFKAFPHSIDFNYAYGPTLYSADTIICKPRSYAEFTAVFIGLKDDVVFEENHHDT